MGLFDRFKKRVKEVAEEVDSEALGVAGWQNPETWEPGSEVEARDHCEQ